MIRNQRLSIASLLVILQCSAALTSTNGRTSRNCLPLAFHGSRLVDRETKTKLDAFSAPTFVPSSPQSKIRCGQPSHYNHRHSASDWLHNIKSVPQSTVLREILSPVISVSIWATVVSLLHKIMASSGNSFIQKTARDMCISSTPHSFLVSSLGLLLVFRTNSAYQRFAEGRKIWENILTISRNVSRMVNLYSQEIGSDRKRRILKLTAAFPYLLRHHIREGCLCESVDENSIPESSRLMLNPPPVYQVDTRHEGDKVGNGELQQTPRNQPCYVDTRNVPWSLFESRKALSKCAIAYNRPLWVCDRIGTEMMKIPYGPNFTSRERLSLLSQVDKLSNAIGECERIHTTAVPLNYARHSLRSLTLWLVTLPFALVKDMGLLTGPIMGVIAWLLFGVYQIGYSIEDPFQGSLRLSILCDAIRRDVLGDSNARETAFAEQEEKKIIPEYNDLSLIFGQDTLADDLFSQPAVEEAKNQSWSGVGV